MEEALISPDFNLEQISRAIMGEEAWGFVFRGNEITLHEGKEQNVASFADFESGAYPNRCVVHFGSAQKPAGHVKEWKGNFLVEGKVRNVVLYRSEA